jgi:hypothetical protein
MLLACYLASAALFYAFVSKRAPIVEEPVFAAAQDTAPCEVIELFVTPADQSASRAA